MRTHHRLGSQEQPDGATGFEDFRIGGKIYRVYEFSSGRPRIGGRVQRLAVTRALPPVDCSREAGLAFQRVGLRLAFAGFRAQHTNFIYATKLGTYFSSFRCIQQFIRNILRPAELSQR